jgi:hypothetical protein
MRVIKIYKKDVKMDFRFFCLLEANSEEHEEQFFERGGDQNPFHFDPFFFLLCP